jgi:L-cysteine S-thiosulfotransferase
MMGAKVWRAKDWRAKHWRTKAWRAKACFVLTALAPAASLLTPSAHSADWPTDVRLSGSAFLPPSLRQLQSDRDANPVGLWLDRGEALWNEGPNGLNGRSCQSCHGTVTSLKDAATRFPRLSADSKKLVNLEDQIIACRERSRAGPVGAGTLGAGTLSAGPIGARLLDAKGAEANPAPPLKPDDADILALSALLHDKAKGLPIAPAIPPTGSTAHALWQSRLTQGTVLYATRMGRMNLACVHCHDQHVGKTMRSDVISPGNPTGFPVYRVSWQTLGSADRRLRACFSGVQAQVPPAGDPSLRDLELYLKVRASGMPLDGPSLRR